VTLVVTGNTISGRIFLFQWVPEFYWHRLLLTGSRGYIHWVIDRRTKPNFCVFSVLNVAVMEKCCDACGYGEYYLRSGFSAS
jgi:predicted nucleic-acid-binding Zn-ribbon protein